VGVRVSLFTFQLGLTEIALDMMIRGVRVNANTLTALAGEVDAAMAARIAIVEGILDAKLDRLNKDGEPTFFRSGPQIKALMERLGQRPGVNRKTKRDSYDDEVLFRIGKRTPGLAALCNAIIEYRSLGTMRSNFIRARLDDDGRMRCSWNIAGPETFRWASSKNAFWRGTNLENIGKPFHALTGTPLPNLRSAIEFDEGCVGWEPDLAGADARVVAWDSGDENMKAMFKANLPIHAVRSKEIYGTDAGPDGRREPYYTLTKKGGHAWSYGGKARTIGISLGLTMHETDKLLARLAGLHPGVPRWHKRIAAKLVADRTITNAFGYRIIYFKRPGDCLTDALAWIGQGTVACAINRVMDNIDRNVVKKPELLTEFMMNQHDSLVGQTKIELWPIVKPLLHNEFMSVVIPYEDPLIIPPDLKTSSSNWGAMRKEKW
jgi:DNA polymerase I-like protein with 3'-5' exonuclease and polymerase domains